MAKEIQIAPRNKDNGKHLYAFSCFNITNEDIALGLRHIKMKVHFEFKKLAKRYHPDSNYYQSPRAAKFKELIRLRKRILGLRTMPISMDTIEVILDIGKGYKITEDGYELPFGVNI